MIGEVLSLLIQQRIEFAVHYPTSHSAVITITGPLKTEQLKALPDGSVLERNGTVRYLISQL